MAVSFVETPLMRQYAMMKKKHPDAVLLFRVGDFYETFADDAITASEILGITLTRRANGKAASVPLAGFPHHALDSYLPKLIRAGKRVAICEQLEDPKLAKKLVKRDITELVTPGVNINDSLLTGRENNFLGGVHFGPKQVGVAFLDISTGEFMCAQGSPEYVDKLLGGFRPKELLVMRGLRSKAESSFKSRPLLFELDDWLFTLDAAKERLLQHFETTNLKGFGVDAMTEAVIAAGVLLRYLDITKHPNISHITSLSRIDEEKYVRLDPFTVRNLELLRPMGDEGKSLIDILDRTVSPMGGRLLRRWVLFPLRDVKAIEARQNVVEYFFRHPDTRSLLTEVIASVGDLERIAAKVAVGRVGPRELVSLGRALSSLAPMKEALSKASAAELRSAADHVNVCELLTSRIARTLREDAPALLTRGNFIAEGFSPELDELRAVSSGGKQYLNDILAREIKATGIPSLKIAFNNVFGYYIEVRNTHKDKVPETWIRKQTLVSAERYITPELKEYEQKILGAEEKIAALEVQLFNELVQETTRYIPAIQTDAAIVARLDALLAFTQAAEEYRYVRPQVDNEIRIDITAGRHPVIERQLPPGEPYVANSLCLDAKGTQIMMITGPNMSGKSALLRQTALITLMAQIGSFVPADAAKIGVVDKIFTRVGASDNISQGESTFMVEMNEAASILNNMSPRSLILFDELGRGTSTYDGISIAWAIVEHLHQNPTAHPLTLFATHYHELGEMENKYERVANYNVAVEETDGRIIFLRKLRRGAAQHSYGIHVARLAGLPRSVVKRAEQVLTQLESASTTPDEGNGTDKTRAKLASTPTAGQGAYQLSFFQLDDPLLSQIRDKLLGLDVNNLTPLQALSTLSSLQDLLHG